MEENVLKDYETFNEFPDKYLELSEKSDYYYIAKTVGSFVVKRRIDLISTVKIYNIEKILQKESYYNVEDGNLILKTESLSNLDGSNLEFVKKEKNVKVIHLSSILDEQEELIYLSKEDIKKIIKKDATKAKTYIMSLKKY